MRNLIRRLRQHRFNSTVITAYILFFLAGGIVTLSGVFLLTHSVDVLQNWVLMLPAGDIHEGDTVTLSSQYTKVRSVSGVATRYIECKNPTRLIIRYPLNTAVADRALGNSGTGITLALPDTIPNTPTQCRFSINVLYHIYPGRDAVEFVASKWFTLLPKQNQASSAALQPARQTSLNQTLTSPQFQVVGGLPSFNDTASTLAAQSNTLQENVS